MNTSLLCFQKEILAQVSSEDGLVIFAPGLGQFNVLCHFLSAHAAGTSFVLVLNLNDVDEQMIKSDLVVSHNCSEEYSMTVIDSSVSASERKMKYASGGIFSISPTILVVDLLNNSFPAHLITGLIVANAHRVSENSNEAFIIRLVREQNSEAFIKAFSDKPEMFCTGFAKLEKYLRWLCLKKVFLWPRFQVNVSEELESKDIDLTEYHQPLSITMSQMQRAILDIVEACIQELKKLNPFLDTESTNVEHFLFKQFDRSLRRQLDPFWHRISSKTKRLVSDLKLLRTTLDYLIHYDCVSFHLYLNSIIASENITNPSPWLHMDSADLLFQLSKERVYQTKSSNNGQIDLIPVLERNPKWNLLKDILCDISIKSSNESMVLIMVKDEKSSKNILDFLRSEGKFLETSWENFMKWKFKLSRISQSKSIKKENSTDTSTKTTIENRFKRRRVRGGSLKVEEPRKTNVQQISYLNKMFQLPQNEEQSGDFELEVENSNSFKWVNPDQNNNKCLLLHVKCYCNNSDEDDNVIRSYSPSTIIMYDASPHFVRRVEVFNAKNPSKNISVHFLIYENSVEEQIYLSTIKKEKQSFEKLIRDKSLMAIQKEQDLKGSIQKELQFSSNSFFVNYAPSTERPSIIVDTREFRSQLPIVLHSKGINLIPSQIEVGDYVLTPDTCVERKSMNDLLQSFNSGRLYSQIEKMCIHYKTPILLIEFDDTKAFHLQAQFNKESDISAAGLMSKITLLTINFPKLRIIWSSSLAVTAEIYLDLKMNKKNPDLEQTLNIGKDKLLLETDKGSGALLNYPPVEFVQHMPGMFPVSYKYITGNIKNIRELVEKSTEELESVLGNRPKAEKLAEFMNRIDG